MTDIKFIGTNQVELVNSLSGTTIAPTSSGGGFIEFNIAINTLSKNDKDYYHFVIPSTVNSIVTVSGVIGQVTTKHQYVNLFKDCYQITDASQLQLTGNIMREFCYSNMFLNCTGLKTPPALPACNLDAWCYAGMFAGCTSLTAAPQLPAMTLAKYCYYGMFYNCKSLSTAPYLPAYDLKEFCYTSMFFGCDKLGSNNSRCIIQGEDLVEGSCANMFTKCENVKQIALYAGNWDTTPNTSAHCNATNVWAYETSSTGFFGKIKQLDILRGYNYIPTNWNVGEDIPLIFKSTGNTKISLNKVGEPTSSKFRVTKNWGVVSSYTIGDWIELEDGDIATFRGDRPYLNTSNSTMYQFATSGAGTLALSGKLAAMSRGTPSAANVYRRLFYNCENITDAKDLQIPSTGFGNYAFASLFAGCNNLSSTPALPATRTTTGCYQHMFNGCTSLNTTPALPATVLTQDCYRAMFYNCSSLKSVSANLLPASNLTSGCYRNMFYGCSALTGTPNLTATSIAPSCYYAMFAECHSLTKVPDNLPAMTLKQNCYQNMFYNCVNLRVAPALLATTLQSECYRAMFYGCSSLSSIHTEFTNWASGVSATTNWVSGVASDGEFFRSAYLTQNFGDSYIPNGWTVYEIYG